MKSVRRWMAAIACLVVLHAPAVVLAGPNFGNNDISFTGVPGTPNYKVTAADPVLTKLVNGFKVEYSYEIEILVNAQVDTTWVASRKFDLPEAEMLGVRINGNTLITTPDKTRLELVVSGTILGQPPQADFFSDPYIGPKNNTPVNWNKFSKLSLIPAKNGYVLEMFSGPVFFPNAVGDKFKVSSEYVVTVVPEPGTLLLAATPAALGLVLVAGRCRPRRAAV